MVVICCAWTKDRTGKVAEYVTENVEVEEYGPQYYSQRGEDCPPVLILIWLSIWMTWKNMFIPGSRGVFQESTWWCLSGAIPTSTCLSRHDTGTLTQIPAPQHFARVTDWPHASDPYTELSSNETHATQSTAVQWSGLLSRQARDGTIWESKFLKVLTFEGSTQSKRL